MKIASAVLIFLSVFRLSRTEDCDVRMWYLKMSTKGVFDGELSEEKLFIKKTINDMVLNSKKDQTKRKVSCDVLEMYEEMLKPDEEEDSSNTQHDEDVEGQGREVKSSDKMEDIGSGESLTGSETGTENIESKANEDIQGVPNPNFSEDSSDQLTDKGTNLNSDKETVTNGLEVDETELFSDDSDDDEEEEEEEVEETAATEADKTLSDGILDELENFEQEEITLSSADELDETSVTVDDSSAAIYNESEGVVEESKNDKEEKAADSNVAIETEKETAASVDQINKDRDQKQIEPTENENKDKKVTTKDDLEKDDSTIVTMEKTKENELNNVATGASENEKKPNEKDREKEEENKESKEGNIDGLSLNASASDGYYLKKLKRVKEEKENNTISFGKCRKDRSYQFDIFDYVQNRYGFLKNSDGNNKTETHGSTNRTNSSLNKENSETYSSSPMNLTYCRLVCSPCSILMKHYTANTSCSVNTVATVYTQLKSNETQNNQTNTHNNNVEVSPKSEASDSVETKEISETSIKNVDEENKVNESTLEAHDTNVDVAKLSMDVAETESKETDESNSDSDGTQGVDRETDSIVKKKLTDKEELTENTSENDQLKKPDDKQMEDAIVPPDADSLSHDVKGVDVNKITDKKLVSEENIPETEQKTLHETDRQEMTETSTSVSSTEMQKGQDGEIAKDKYGDEKLTISESESKQKTEQVADSHRHSEKKDLVERNDQRKETVDSTDKDSEKVETTYKADQPNIPETTTDGKQTPPEEKQTTAGTVDRKTGSNEPSGKPEHTVFLEELQSNFDNFQEQVVSKTDGYSKKLQNLELMVIQLENQLLKETLNKNNHSSTITRLENHILKLENELLKLNQSYNEVKKESESMVKDRKKYLQLGHESQQTQAYGYSMMNRRDHPVSVDFQAKITYLNHLLNNQSITIKQLKTRSQYLEDQNRLLYNMIMNQTALMTQIMNRVQDLTEQNIQQRIEAQKIRQQIEKIVSKRSEVETTDKYLLNKLEEMVSDVQKRTLDEDDEQELKQIKMSTVNKDKSEEELEKYMQTESVSPTKTWCEHSSETVCIVKTCIPFSRFQWTACVGRKSSEKETPKSIPESSGIPKDKEEAKRNLSVDVSSSSKDEVKNDSPTTTKVSHEKMDSDAHSNNNAMNGKENAQKKGDPNNGVETKVEVNEMEGKSGTMEKEEVKNDKAESKDVVKETADSNETKDKPVKDNLEKQVTPDTAAEGSEKQVAPDTATKDAEDPGKQTKTSDTEGKTEKQTQEVKTSPSKRGSVMETTDNTNGGKVMSNTKTVNKEENVPANKPVEKETPGKEPEDKVKTPTLKVMEQQKEETLDKGTREPEKKNKESTNNKAEGSSDTKVVEDANNVKNPTKETSVEGDVKDQDKKERDLKLENAKEAISDGQREQPKEEIAKAKENDEGKVLKKKSREKKPKEPLKKPIKYEATGQKEPKDCYDYYKRGNLKNGVFKIKPYGEKSMVEVFCDMKNGGWTVIQKRQDGTTKFLKRWQDYKEGFGGIRGEHWLGNDHIHYLTNQDHYKLRIELTDWNKTKKVAEYDYFMIDDENDGYRLHIGGYHGDAGDGMAKHHNNKFSTFDVDNDKVTKEFGGNCAKRFSGAWWYYKCYMSNLNGIYYRNGVIPAKMFDGIAWKPWTGSNYSLRSAEMKIRPSDIS